MKFGFDWPSGFKEEDDSLGLNYFHNINILSIFLFPASFPYGFGE